MKKRVRGTIFFMCDGIEVQMNFSTLFMRSNCYPFLFEETSEIRSRLRFSELMRNKFPASVASNGEEVIVTSDSLAG